MDIKKYMPGYCESYIESVLVSVSKLCILDIKKYMASNCSFLFSVS